MQFGKLGMKHVLFFLFKLSWFFFCNNLIQVHGLKIVYIKYYVFVFFLLALFLFSTALQIFARL